MFIIEWLIVAFSRWGGIGIDDRRRNIKVTQELVALDEPASEESSYKVDSTCHSVIFIVIVKLEFYQKKNTKIYLARVNNIQ